MQSSTVKTGAFGKIFKGRFSVFFFVLGLYLSLSFLVRCSLMFWSFGNLESNMVHILRAFLSGFLYDLAVGISFLMLYALYLLVFPKRWIGLAVDKTFTYGYLGLMLFIMFFSLMAEFPFWDEFGARFNFIAVDYLIYTYEVVANINQSYPLPLIIAALVLLEALSFFMLYKTGAFARSFSTKTSFTRRAFIALPVVLTGLLLLTVLSNKRADFSNSKVVNELGKNGVFSFFAAYKSNELNYDLFYPKLAEQEAYLELKQHLLQTNQSYESPAWNDIKRLTKDSNEIRPNIILITIESFSAEYLSAFGNKNNITPVYDSLANQSIFFKNLYATGTRTVRGMEALTLCVPPTPGNSIVRRANNDHLLSIASILTQKNYQPYFIYGGDGYFDNMNNYFGGQGFDIVDRNRGNPLSDNIKTKRYNIEDADVNFENAWGICDEDLYRQAIKYADKSNAQQKPFFQFIMTTSNHKPYTFPNGKIDLPQGSRDAAVKYTDYAIGKFISAAKQKPWFANTVFVIVADHCASSAGKWEINIDKHHIPAIIYNLPVAAQKIDRLTSQIDLMPTLFGYLHWSYKTALYGKDINQTKAGDERAFLGNYRTLGMLKADVFTQIDDRKNVKQFMVSTPDDSLTTVQHPDQKLVKETISYYQTASERFTNNQMKE